MNEAAGLLNRAWDAITNGDLRKARNLLDGDEWTKFDQAEQNDKVREYAKNAKQGLLKLSQDDTQYWLSKPLSVEKTITVIEDGVYVEKQFTVKDLITRHLNSDALLSDNENAANINSAFLELRDVLNNVNTTREAQAAALTAHEQKRFSELTDNKGFFSKIAGVVRYNGELIRDRWKGSHADGELVTFDASGGLFSNIKSTPNPDPEAVQKAAKRVREEAKKSKGNVNINALSGGIGNLADQVANNAKDDINPPNDNLRKVTLDGKSLGELSNVSKLDTPFKKGCAAAITALGGGLVIHGAHNAMCAFNPQSDKHLQVEELGQTQQKEGINWTRLAVGAGEAALGAAIAYRGLAGRWGLGAVEGYAGRL